MPRSNIELIGAGLMIGLGLGALVIAAVGLGGAFLSGRPGLEPISAPVANSMAPDFQLQTLSGETVRLSDFRGHAVVLNFWATWCGPCRLEMPLFEKYHEQYSPNLVVLAVNDGEPTSDVKSFVNELGMTFRVLLDPTTGTEDLYRVRAFPTTFFVDADGMIRYQHIGTLNEGQLVQYLKQVGVGQ